MEHFYKKIDTKMFNFADVYREAVCNAQPEGTLVEVGSWMGQSLAFLAVEAINSKKDLRVISIDAFLGNVHGGAENPVCPQWENFRSNLRPVWSQIQVIKSNSAEAAYFFPDGTLDFVFIDADHHYEAVCADLKAWWPKVRSGGLFAGHDLQHEPIQKALQEFISSRSLLPWRQIGNCWLFKK